MQRAQAEVEGRLEAAIRECYALEALRNDIHAAHAELRDAVARLDARQDLLQYALHRCCQSSWSLRMCSQFEPLRHDGARLDVSMSHCELSCQVALLSTGCFFMPR